MAIQARATDVTEAAQPAGAPTPPTPERRTPRATAAFRFVSTFIVLAGAAAIVHGLLWATAHPAGLPYFMIAAAFALGVVRLPAYGSWVSLSIIPVIAAAYLGGPAGGALAGCASGVGGAVHRRQQMRRELINIGLHGLAGYAGGAAGSFFTHAAASSVGPLLLFSASVTLAMYAVSVPTVSLLEALAWGTGVGHVWRERFRWLLLQNLLLAQVGTGLAVAYRFIGPYELVAFATPIVAAQLSWKQYLAHTTRNVEELRAKNADLVQLASRLQAANDAVLNTYRGTLEALVGALDARDNEVQGHSYRVSAYSQVVAERMGVERSSTEWEAITRGALLHDVGKIGVRDAVLLKPGKLDEQEWAEMRTHAEIGFGILRDIEFLRSAATLVRAHHERFDGAGYPLGLRGEEIPLGARIFAVCDTFDAITSDRPYRRAAPPAAAVAEIKRCAGTQFDPAVVKAFEEVWPQLWLIRANATDMVA